MAETVHIGRKIARVRELRGMKQEHLAQELGVSQQTVSNIENSAKIDDEVLEKIAKALGVTSEGINRFNDEAIITYFNTFNDSSANNGAFYAHHFYFNAIDKVIELYERLLESEREKTELIKKTQI